MAQLGASVGREAAATPAPLPSGYLLAALVLLLVAPPALAGWVAGVWVVRVGWVSRGRLAAAGGVTGALAVLLIGLTRAAGGLLGAVATLGPIGPECESCGRLDELAAVTGDTPAGILCMTLCDDCEVAGVDPIFTRQSRPPASSRTVSTWDSTATR